MLRKLHGKVSVFVYERGSAATKKLDKLMQDPLNEITIADNEEIHLIRAFDGSEFDTEADWESWSWGLLSVL